MTETAQLERASLDVLAALPAGWVPGLPSYDPGTGTWSCTVRGPDPGRGSAPETITGTGDDKVAALVDLATQLERRRAVTPTFNVQNHGFVFARGVNLGRPDNVAGCFTFVVAVGAFLACVALVILVSAVYEAAGGISPEIVRGFADAVFLLGLGFMFGFPLVVVLLARPGIRRWVGRHTVSNR
jgi:hypothetical protein